LLPKTMLAIRAAKAVTFTFGYKTIVRPACSLSNE